MRNYEAGDTVVLNGCQIWIDNRETVYTGLVELVEYWPYEPSNYVHEDMWVLALPDREFELGSVTVSAYDLMEQIYPASYGRMLVQEREMDFAEES